MILRQRSPARFVLIFSAVLLSFGGTLPVYSADVNETLSLEKVNESNGETFVDKIYSLPPSDLLEFRISDIPSDCGYVLVQAHSIDLISLELGVDKTNGFHLGVILSPPDESAVFQVRNLNPHAIKVLLVAIPYGKEYPVPGGCALEFATKNAPYLNIEVADELITVKGQKAGNNTLDKYCFPNNLVYEFYYIYDKNSGPIIPEDTFKTIGKLLTYSAMANNSHEAHYMTGPPNQRVFAVYSSFCFYYGMAVRGGGHAAVYTPNMHCFKTTTTPLSFLQKLAIASLIPIGVLLCSAKPVLFPVKVFLSSGLVSYTISYVGAVNFGAGGEEAFVYSLILGFLCACAILLLWMAIRIPAVCFLVSISCGSYLLTASVFFFIAGNDSIFVSDVTYWGAMSGVFLILFTALTVLPSYGMAVSLSILGGYLIVFAVDYVVGSSVRYIAMNPIRRLTIDGFNASITSPPLPTAALLMIIVWVFVAVHCSQTQLKRLEGRAPFPPPPRFNVESSEEGRPLLISST